MLDSLAKKVVRKNQRSHCGWKCHRKTIKWKSIGYDAPKSTKVKRQAQILKVVHSCAPRRCLCISRSFTLCLTSHLMCHLEIPPSHQPPPPNPQNMHFLSTEAFRPGGYNKRQKQNIWLNSVSELILPYRGVEPRATAWKADMLPIHQYGGGFVGINNLRKYIYQNMRVRVGRLGRSFRD